MKRQRLFQYIILFVLFSVNLTSCGGTQTLLTSIPTSTSKPITSTITPSQMPITTITPTLTVGPGGFPRRFHVEGNAFVDQFGRKMIFRGMATPEVTVLALRGISSWNKKYYQAMASWGANIIRLPIWPTSVHNNDWSTIFQILDTTIAWAGENKIYVVLDFHSVGWIPDNWYPPNNGYETNMQDFLNFWDTISRHYADNDTVAFYELFNEPGTNNPPVPKKDWQTWKGVVDQVIPVIRANDPDKIILVDGLEWGYDLSAVADDPIADSNVGYGAQPYPMPSSYFHQSWDTAFGNLSSQYPVFATEFGYEEDMQDYKDIMIGNIPYHQAIIDYLEAHHISWMVWVFDSDWQTRLLLNNQTFAPSPSGEYFRSRLLELNGHP